MKIINEDALQNMTEADVQKKLAKVKQVRTLLIVTQVALSLTIFLPFLLFFAMCWVVKKVNEILEGGDRALSQFLKNTRINKALRTEESVVAANRKSLENRWKELTGDSIGKEKEIEEAVMKMRLRKFPNAVQADTEEVE